MRNKIQGLITSEEDVDLLNFSWRLDKGGYAVRGIKTPSRKSKVALKFHHAVCMRAFGRRPDWSKREVCDHINGNKLDNRRENLRIVSSKFNTRAYWAKNPGKGVCYNKVAKKYQAIFRTKFVGLFDDEASALEAIAVKTAEAQLSDIPYEEQP